MKIEFTVLPERQTIVIEIEGHVSASDVASMRERTLEEMRRTKFTNFIVDMRKLESIEGGNSYAIFELGERFGEIGLSVWTNTAALMPTCEAAKQQVELLHSVEINRGRGVLNYVETHEEAFSWFEDMNVRKGPDSSR